MTLNDPLLKDLKGHVGALALSGTNGPFRDSDERVFALCICLERIFSKGLIRHDGFTPWKTDSFQWFYQHMRKYHRIIPLVFKIAFDEVLSNSKTKTPIGKTRLLIRTCLKRRCLFVPLQLHVENEDWADTSLRVNYDPVASVLGHEIFCRILLSLTQQLSFYDFSLDLSNSSFLDEAWQLPSVIRTEMVPCDRLGLTLGFPMGFPLIVEILENSCAAEIKDLIAVGDILDEINGICVRNFFGSKIELLFRKIKSQPFHLTFIKGLTPQSGQVYLPIIKLYRILGLDPEVITRQGSRAQLSLDPTSHSVHQSRIWRKADYESEERLLLDEAYDDYEQDPRSGHSPKPGPLPPQPDLLLDDEEGPPPSKPHPYPESQNNVSPTSALNLQRYPNDTENLIV